MVQLEQAGSFDIVNVDLYRHETGRLFLEDKEDLQLRGFYGHRSLIISTVARAAAAVRG